MWECSECSVENELDPDAEEGQVVICFECGSEFEVIAVDPFECTLLDYEPVGESVDADDEDDWDSDED